MNELADYRHVIPARWREGIHVATRQVAVAGADNLFGSLIRGRSGARRERRQRVRGTQTYVSATRNELEALSVVLAGQARYRDLAGRWHRLGPGMLFRMHSAGRRSLTVLEPGPGFAECSFFIRGPVTADLRAYAVWEDDFTVAEARDPIGLARCFVDIHQWLLTPSRTPHQALRRAAVVIDRLYRHCRGDPPGDDLVDQACRLLVAHPEAGYHEHDLAAELGVAVDTLRRRFRRRLGRSPAAVQVEQRMAQAAERLRSGALVRTVAAEFGYEDPGAFSRQFKRALGISPSRFRPAAGESD